MSGPLRRIRRSRDDPVAAHYRDSTEPSPYRGSKMSAAAETEHLTTGWEPDVDSGDTVVLAAVRNMANRVERHGEAMGFRVCGWDDFIACDTAMTNPFCNFCVLTAPPPDWDDTVHRIRTFYAASGGMPYVVWSPFPTPDMASRGLRLCGHPPFMYRAAGGEGPALPEGLEVVEVSDDAGHADFWRACGEFFPFDGIDLDVFASYSDTRVDDFGWRLWVGRLDGEIVSTATSYTDSGTNQVEMVSTSPQVRGRGIGAAVTWTASTADPDLPAVLVSSDMGRGVYERLGYVSLSRWTLWYGGL